MIKILYIEDDIEDADILKRILKRSKIKDSSQFDEQDENIIFSNPEIIHVQRLDDGLSVLSSTTVDIVILDLSLPDGDGLHSFETVHNQYPSVPVVVLTGTNDEQLAMKAVKLGAQDYLVKGQVNNPLLIRSIMYAIERQKMLTKLDEIRRLEHHLAYHDSLTNLPNRQLFTMHLTQAIARAKRNASKFAILFIDLDGFKNVNDSLGHDIGDQLLKVLANKLKQCVRQSDMVARLGGDEFSVILDGISDVEDAAIVANKILQVFAEPIQIKDNKLTITTSIGISIYPADGNDEKKLLKNADRAMYRAKTQGKNNYKLFNVSIDEIDGTEFDLEIRLGSAVTNNEFLLYYQPQLDVKTGVITGIEALIRWRHPKFGLIQPTLFLPLAEETGLVDQIGKWVVATACHQNKKLQDQGFPTMRVAINLSGRQFREEKNIDVISSVLTETGLLPHYLTLEISERSAMQNIEHTEKMFQQFKKLGVRISVDDFGTSRSSLSCLKRFPLDMLKIDRSFIQKLIRDADETAVTYAIIKLAHNLDMKVIAEGVENQDQFNFLSSSQCDEIQGFHISKPLPPKELIEFLKSKQFYVPESATIPLE